MATRPHLLVFIAIAGGVSAASAGAAPLPPQVTMMLSGASPGQQPGGTGSPVDKLVAPMEGCSDELTVTHLSRDNPCVEDEAGTMGSTSALCPMAAAETEWGRLYTDIDGPRSITHFRAYLLCRPLEFGPVVDPEGEAFEATYSIFETEDNGLGSGDRGLLLREWIVPGVCEAAFTGFYITIPVDPALMLEAGKNYYASIVIPRPQLFSVFSVTPANWDTNLAPTYWASSACLFPTPTPYSVLGICDECAEAPIDVDDCCASLIDLVASRPIIRSDPHFLGLDGRAYDITGIAGTTYSLLSDSGLAVNALFDTAYTTGLDAATGLPYHAKGTWVTALGVVTHEGSAVIHANGTVASTGTGVIVADDWPRVTVETVRTVLHVEAAGPPHEWGVSAADAGAYTHLNLYLGRTTFSTRAHGLLGVTVRRPAVAVGGPIPQARRGGHDGEGVIEGHVSEYAVASLLSTDFTHSAYGSDAAVNATAE